MAGKLVIPPVLMVFLVAGTLWAQTSPNEGRGLILGPVREPFQYVQIPARPGLDAQDSQRSQQQADQAFNLALQLERSGNLEQALTIYSQLVADFPENQRYYQQLKQLLRDSARFAELLRVIDNHLRLYPNDMQGQVELGEVQLAMGQKSLALRTWEGILERFPGNLVGERLVLTQMLISGLTDEGTALLGRLRTAKGDSSFFALEMGQLYAAQLTYGRATEELLRYLTVQPQAFSNVLNLMLRFPDQPEVIAGLRETLARDGSPVALRILATLEFKHRNFEQAVELFYQLDMPPQEWLDLGRDLMAEGELDLARQLMEQLLANPDAVDLYEQAVLGLAEIYELRSTSQQVYLPLSGFYQGNHFFTLPFIRVADSQLVLLREAMVLYDSLITTWRNPEARLRMGDIRYLILDDFDGAIADFEAILANPYAAQYYPEVFLRLVNVWIAKGDLETAEQVRRQATSRLKTKEQLTQVEVKEVELLFLSGDLDSLLAYVGGQLTALGPADPSFNDLMELSILVGQFKYWPRQYQTFVQSERLLRRNRRSEAINLLSAELGREQSPVSPVLQYRLAHLQALQGNYSAAENLSLAIAGDAEFSELGLLLAAELADYLQRDRPKASSRYLAFMDTYPSSVYSDNVRLRYRELNPGSD